MCWLIWRTQRTGSIQQWWTTFCWPICQWEWFCWRPPWGWNHRSGAGWQWSGQWYWQWIWKNEWKLPSWNSPWSQRRPQRNFKSAPTRRPSGTTRNGPSRKPSKIPSSGPTIKRGRRCCTYPLSKWIWHQRWVSLQGLGYIHFHTTSWRFIQPEAMATMARNAYNIRPQKKINTRRKRLIDLCSLHKLGMT